MQAVPVRLDIVIPVFNEEAMVPILLRRLRTVFSAEVLEAHGLAGVETIFVDDGSCDNTAGLLALEIRQGFPGRLLRLSRNFGHQCAVSAGLAHARGDVTAILDADLQDPPEVVLEMLKLWRQGNDVVNAVRRKRKEGPVKRFLYWAFYRLLAMLSEIDVVKDSGDFCLMDRRVVQAINSLPERVRFNRGLRAWVGFRQIAHQYERAARQAGEPKYSLRDLYRLATDGLVSSGIRPLKAVQIVCFLMGGFCLAVSTASLLFWLRGDASREVLFLAISCSVTSFTGFTILGSLHLLSGYLGRAYLEIKARPGYLVWEEIRFDENIRIPIRGSHVLNA